jgi:hypothetical protein
MIGKPYAFEGDEVKFIGEKHEDGRVVNEMNCPFVTLRFVRNAGLQPNNLCCIPT